MGRDNMMSQVNKNVKDNTKCVHLLTGTNILNGIQCDQIGRCAFPICFHLLRLSYTCLIQFILHPHVCYLQKAKGSDKEKIDGLQWNGKMRLQPNSILVQSFFFLIIQTMSKIWQMHANCCFWCLTSELFHFRFNYRF